MKGLHKRPLVAERLHDRLNRILSHSSLAEHTREEIERVSPRRVGFIDTQR